MQGDAEEAKADLERRAFELAEARERLRKREDELRDLKLSLNLQISNVDSEYRGQIESLREEVSSLTSRLEEATSTLKEKERCYSILEDERQEMVDRYERQRLCLQQSSRELIEAQSAVVDTEERLLSTEQQLGSVKAAWANAEHERE